MPMISPRAVEIERTLPPAEWAQAVTDLDEPSKQYLRDRYRLWRDRRRLSHRNDPDTSRQAAALVDSTGTRDNHITAIVSAVRRHPGRTSAELAQITGLERHEAARRTADAEHRGLIRKGPARKCSLSHRAAVTWCMPLTEAQRECLEGAA